ncbi:hypothetical protein [Paenibacillus marinisediminis]
MGNTGPELLFKQLTDDVLITGIVSVARESVDMNLRPFIDWHLYLIVLTDDIEAEGKGSVPMIIENDKEMRIVIDRVPIRELLEVTGVEYYDIKRLISLGKIEFDRDGRLFHLKQTLSENSETQVEQLLFRSFAAYIDAYMRAKQSLMDGQELDAYQYVTAALTEWARVSVLESGGFGHDLIWHQVRFANPGVYKLYEELINSRETISQRVELALLACEFSMTNKLNSRLAPLIRVLRESKDGFTMHELQRHEELHAVATHLPMVMEKLLLRGFVQSSFTLPEPPWDAVGLVPVYRWNDEREVALER